MSSGFGWLFAAEAAFSVGSKILEYNDEYQASYYNHLQVNSQTALNNGLGYNALLAVNEEEQREFEKLALDKFELQKSIQRALATQLARDGSKLNLKQAFIFQLLKPIFSHSAEGRKLFFRRSLSQGEPGVRPTP